MPALLEFLATDNTTVITTLDLGSVPSPGTSTQTKLYVKNVGTQSSTATTVTIETIGTNDGSLYARLAPDSGGVPGSFSTGSVSLGTLAVNGEAPFWVETVLIAGLTPDLNPRRFTLEAQGLSV